jgi:hypothetical protein
MVTDPLGEVTMFTFDRDTVSSKARLNSVSGTCPVCAVGPNTSFEYNDPANPMLPTAAIDEDGEVDPGFRTAC